MTRLQGAADIIPGSIGATPRCVEWSDEWAQWCFLSQLVGSPSSPRGVQLREVLESMEAALADFGFAFSDVIRTWFVVDDILDWYDEFNAVRTQFFTQRGVFEKLVPASTGVGGKNAAGGAVVASAVAIRPRNEACRVRQINSPRQCEARDYGSAFGRAIEASWPGSRRLWVSGTASIDARGESVHEGNVQAQTLMTLDVVEELLESASMRWNDVLEAKAYFRHAEDAELERFLRQRGLAAPIACAQAEICRDELLFELELTAGSGPGPKVEWLR